MIWQKPDGSGATGRVVFGYDPVTSNFVYDRASPEKALSRADLAGILKETNQQPVALNPEPSVWAPDKEVINSAYKGTIAVGVAALTTLVNEMLSGN